ncbi:MAG: GNAT family N-acetyltransferase [Crocinitomix sp.]|nr:GNAT family N-acetyltransferase [Crocinitomix sp.]
MKNTSIHIRKAKASDMDAVFNLIKELAVYEKAANQVTNSVENLIEDGFGTNPVFNCIVAEVDQKVIGFALYYSSYSTWTGRCLYLEDFLVTETWRRKGVGKLLFDQVYQIAKETKAKRFEWQVLDWNEPAINFYKKYQANLDETWVNCRLMLAP